MNVEFEELPSLTWKIDFKKKRIAGMIDELAAIKQAVFLILKTERFKYLIFSGDYGSELKGVVSSPRLFVESELTRRIREALLQDDRITDVENFEFIFDSDAVVVSFDVVTEYGRFQTGIEVTNDG